MSTLPAIERERYIHKLLANLNVPSPSVKLV